MLKFMVKCRYVQLGWINEVWSACFYIYVSIRYIKQPKVNYFLILLTNLFIKILFRIDVCYTDNVEKYFLSNCQSSLCRKQGDTLRTGETRDSRGKHIIRFSCPT